MKVVALFVLATYVFLQASDCIARNLRSFEVEGYCKIEVYNKIWRGDFVRFTRKNKLVGEGDIGLLRFPFRTQHSYGEVFYLDGSPGIEYEFSPSSKYRENFVFFQVKNETIGGFIILRDVSGASKLRVYLYRSPESQIAVNIKYQRPQKLDDIFGDLACLARGLISDDAFRQ